MLVTPYRITNAEAFRGFVDGVQNLQDYFRTNSSARLVEAEEHFNDSLKADPQFPPAQYYKAIVLTHARKANEAIQILEQLDKEEVSFKTEVLYNLAFAYGKTYNYEKVKLALEVITKAEAEAIKQEREDLRLLATALKAWVNAVFGAYSFEHPEDFEKRQKEHLPEAMKLAELVLKDGALTSIAAETSLAVKVEANGAAGGALMYMGMYSARFQDTTDRYWKRAESYYNAALRLHPRNVRVLDDLVTLNLMRACRAMERNQLNEAKAFASVALTKENEAISYHSRDQFRFFQKAHSLVLLGEWDEAEIAANRILNEAGALTKEMVDELKRLIKDRKPGPILERYRTEEKSVSKELGNG